MSKRKKKKRKKKRRDRDGIPTPEPMFRPTPGRVRLEGAQRMSKMYNDMFPLFPDDKCFLCDGPPDDDFEFIPESWKEGDEPTAVAKICKTCSSKEDRDDVALAKLQDLLEELDELKEREEIYKKAPALAVSDALGRAQESKEFEINSRGLGKHPALQNGLPGFGMRTTEQPRTLKSRAIDGPTGDLAVDFYLALLDTQLSESRYQEDEARRQLATVTWSCLRQAAIIRIPGALYGAFYHLADRYTTERTGAAWHGPDEPPVQQHMSSRQFYQAVVELGEFEPLPEKRPFEYIYFAYEPKIRVNQDLATLYGLHEAQRKGILKEFSLGGHLVGPDSVMACLMLQVRIQDKETDWKPAVMGATSMMMERHSGKWNAPYTLAPWIIPSLIEWVNEHKSVVEDTRSLGYKIKVKKQFKKARLKKTAPPPYYTVRMQDVTIKETAKDTFGTRYKETYEYSHRWTVRGHWMIRVKRGPLPLDANLEADLRKRKYRIFTHNEPDWDTWKHLRHRKVEPKRVDEWMAVLVSWRKDYVKGPEDKPLIPSVRKSGRTGKRRGRKCNASTG
jgi:hypothetical protein